MGEVRREKQVRRPWRNGWASHGGGLGGDLFQGKQRSRRNALGMFLWGEWPEQTAHRVRKTRQAGGPL